MHFSLANDSGLRSKLFTTIFNSFWILEAILGNTIHNLLFSVSHSQQTLNKFYLCKKLLILYKNCCILPTMLSQNVSLVGPYFYITSVLFFWTYSSKVRYIPTIPEYKLYIEQLKLFSKQNCILHTKVNSQVACHLNQYHLIQYRPPERLVAATKTSDVLRTHNK